MKRKEQENPRFKDFAKIDSLETIINYLDTQVSGYFHSSVDENDYSKRIEKRQTLTVLSDTVERLKEIQGNAI